MRRWVFHRLWGPPGMGWGQGEQAGSGSLSPTQALTRPKPWGEDAYQEGGAASSMWMAHAGQTSPICALGLSAGSTSSPGVSPCQPPEQIQDRTRASGCSTLPRVRLYLPVLRRR